MVFPRFSLQVLIILSLIGFSFVSTSPIRAIIELKTETVIEVVTVTVLIPLQTSTPHVDISQQQQQLSAPNVHNGTNSVQLSSDIPTNISSAQNFQYNTKNPDELTAQDDTINILSSPNDPAAKSNNKIIEEAPKNKVTLPSNKVSEAQEAALVAQKASENEDLQEEAGKSPKILSSVPGGLKAQEPAVVPPEISDIEKAAGNLSPSSPVPEVPKAQEPAAIPPEISDIEKAAGKPSPSSPVPEVPEAQEPAILPLELSDEEEAVEKPSPSPPVPEVPKAQEPAAIPPKISDIEKAAGNSSPRLVPEVPIALDPPKAKEISTPTRSPGVDGSSPSQADEILINSPTIPDTPKAQKFKSSKESGEIQDNSPKRAPQVNENTRKFVKALSDYESTALKFHNLHRANHTSSELSWNSTLARFALATAKTCVFEHDFSPGDGNYGQNLAVFGSSRGVESLDKSDLLADSITNKWYNTEFRNVPFGLAKPPTSGPQFLHLTQAGNVLGQFDTKVNRPLGKGTVLTTAFE
ncbi:putative scp-like extracellular protein [Erysiphe neolycopersici]|uniref:Putative scp-like extracellular protein n=1 Tax=Erysiphe neolycopersici TaxID=212602 RepID=A0A420I5B2_9PEZI|nr:putative scp-like extracellular protein [Erysiphe neolycopersici]